MSDTAKDSNGYKPDAGNSWGSPDGYAATQKRHRLELALRSDWGAAPQSTQWLKSFATASQPKTGITVSRSKQSQLETGCQKGATLQAPQCLQLYPLTFSFLFCRRRHSREGHRQQRSGREGQHQTIGPRTAAGIVRCRTRVVPLRTVNKKLRERLAAHPAVPEDVKSEKSRKSRERKRSKRPIRQRKEKYRERECRANRKQHYKLSKPSARHDMLRQRNECDLLPA